MTFGMHLGLALDAHMRAPTSTPARPSSIRAERPRPSGSAGSAGRVLGGKARVARAGKVLTQGVALVGGAVAAASLQLGNGEIHEVPSDSR